MSKAILIMDMPESCLACDIGQDCVDRYIWCPIAGKMAVNIDERQEWCPLRELPAKKEVPKPFFMMGEMYGEEMGWNACVDEITGGGKE